MNKTYKAEKERLEKHLRTVVDEYVELHHEESGSFTSAQLRIIATKMERLKWIFEHEPVGEVGIKYMLGDAPRGKPRGFVPI